MAPAFSWNSSKTVCVMDASGQLGSALVRRLLQRGYTVHAAVHSRGKPTSPFSSIGVPFCLFPPQIPPDFPMPYLFFWINFQSVKRIVKFTAVLVLLFEPCTICTQCSNVCVCVSIIFSLYIIIILYNNNLLQLSIMQLIIINYFSRSISVLQAAINWGRKVERISFWSVGLSQHNGRNQGLWCLVLQLRASLRPPHLRCKFLQRERDDGISIIIIV